MVFSLMTNSFTTGAPPELSIFLCVGMILTGLGVKKGLIGSSDNPLLRGAISFFGILIVIVMVMGGFELAKPGYWDNNVREAVKTLLPGLPFFPPRELTLGDSTTAEYMAELEKLNHLLAQNTTTAEDFQKHTEAQKRRYQLLRPHDRTGIAMFDRVLDAVVGGKDTFNPVAATAGGAKWALLLLVCLGIVLSLIGDTKGMKMIGGGLAFAVLWFGGLYIFPSIAEWWEKPSAKWSAGLLGGAILGGIILWVATRPIEAESTSTEEKK